ncbi:Ribosomal RNA small subunit methyltransferase I [Rickettsiales bacterium Ac37b]|nr:Ribosomal RNA small subunit methyltransferase I [Rickettsiales bacterium Ac37b]
MQGKLTGLYIVATPIGNYEDITLHAMRILRSVDFIICEDTRVTGRLLTHLNIKKSMFCYNDYSTDQDRFKFRKKLSEGLSAALVSDAGTPLISDPGYKLIQTFKEANIKVTTIPGPSSVIAALTVAALPTDRFLFMGFLPNKHEARLSNLKEIKELKASLVFFESAKRLRVTLQAMLEIFGSDRKISILRELTKIYEEHIHGTISELLERYNNVDVKGEIVIVVGPPIIYIIKDVNDINAQEILTLLAANSVKDTAAKLLARYPDCMKKEIYDKALLLSGKKENRN